MTPEELAAEKTAKEVAKLDMEVRQANKLFRLEIFKAVAAVLGPLMTGLTVVGAVWVGLSQITAKSQSDEDALWRDTVKALDNTPAADLAKTHLLTFMKPFLNSPRYRQVAIDVTLDELPKIRDEKTFTDLFGQIFKDVDLASVPLLLRLDKDLKAQASAIYPSDPSSPVPNEWYRIIGLSAIVCGPIASALRKFDHAEIIEKFFGSTKYNGSGVSRNKIPMGAIYFQACDFSDIDFSDIDLSGSSFNLVKVDGAVLVGMDDDPHLWDAETWWRAKYVEASLLVKLIANYKPNQFVAHYTQRYRDGETIKEAEWVENVMRLCRAVALACSDDMIKANFSR